MKMSIGYECASAIAAVNALVTHLGYGNFVSQYDIEGHDLRPEMCEMNGTWLGIQIRTDRGFRFYTTNTIVRKKHQNTFLPVQSVIVGLADQPAAERKYFECGFSEDSIRITRLDKYPF